METARRCVLVVGEHVAERAAVARALAAGGYRVHVAEGGREAVWLMGSLPRPCVVVVDAGLADGGAARLVQLLAQQEQLEDFPPVLYGAAVPGVAAPCVPRPLVAERLLACVRAVHGAA